MADSSGNIDPADGAAFNDWDVARSYAFRTPYPPALFDFLLQRLKRRERALDLGSGPGKISRAIAPHFGTVTAVDPSTPMLEVGRTLDGGRAANIEWICATAEALEVPSGFDLLAAGASIHWMRHEVVFPKMAQWLAADGVLAVVEGDGAGHAPWSAKMKQFVAHWLGKLGKAMNEAGFRASLDAYKRWMDIDGHVQFSMIFEQPIEDLIGAEHSRATWSRTRMGSKLAAEFDADLRDLLMPYAVNSVLRYSVRSGLVYGKPRATQLEVTNG
jgi:ubiquinone/menaquinone biosynthesis C-methylase UbiE